MSRWSQRNVCIYRRNRNRSFWSGGAMLLWVVLLWKSFGDGTTWRRWIPIEAILIVVLWIILNWMFHYGAHFFWSKLAMMVFFAALVRVWFKLFDAVGLLHFFWWIFLNRFWMALRLGKFIGFVHKRDIGADLSICWLWLLWLLWLLWTLWTLWILWILWLLWLV